MKNKLGSMMLLLILTMVLCSCSRMDDTFTISSDNWITETMTIAFEKKATDKAIKESSEYAAVAASITSLPVQTIDGVEYYIDKESNTYSQKTFLAEYPEMIANKDKFYVYYEDTYGQMTKEDKQDLNEMKAYIDFVSYGVTLPSPIVKTNGKQEGENTATWTFTLDDLVKSVELYAYTANDPGNTTADRATVTKQIKAAEAAAKSKNTTPTKKDKKAPVIKGVKKNKTYKKKVTVYVKDNVKIKKVTVNGKKVKLKKVKSGKYKGYYKFTVKKKGKNKIVAVDTSGNKKKITIKIKK